jgi:cytochrome c553
MKYTYSMLAVLILASNSLYAANISGNAERGKKIFTGEIAIEGTAACHTCHGADGNKTQTGLFPKLAGQYAEYLALTLESYKNGARKNAIMQANASRLSKEDINDLSVYLGSLQGDISDLSHVK